MIERYLNVNKNALGEMNKLLALYKPDREINLLQARKCLKKLTDVGYGELGNIQYPSRFFNHCLAVSNTSEGIVKKTLNHYPILNGILNPNIISYLGLVEDIPRCIANETGQEIHEIVGLIYLNGRGFEDIANGTEPHFVGPEILSILQSKGMFLGIEPKLERNIYLKIITVADVLCKTEYLGVNGMLNGLKKGLDDIKNRYSKLTSSILPGEAHLLIQGLEHSGENRLKEWVKEVEQLCEGKVSNDLVMKMYG